MTPEDIAKYQPLLKEIRTRIQAARSRAVLAVNAEMIQLYWDVGRMIDTRQQEEGWVPGGDPPPS